MEENKVYKRLKKDGINKDDILSKSVKYMPQNPASRGISANVIKEYFYEPEEKTLDALVDLEDYVIKELDKVQETSETLNSEVEDIKKGKQTAIAFNSYEEMIENLNSAPNTEYYVSKNIMIKTLDVPDLWVFSVESASEPYTYSSDDEILKKLNEDGTLRVGYYTLAQLEAKISNLNLENGEGVGSIKAIYDTENGPVGSSGNPSESYKPEANGKNGMALTPRAYANGDCAIAGGWSASANTKGDVALSAGQAGMTEDDFNAEYDVNNETNPKRGYPWRTEKRAESINVPSGETYFYSVNNPSTNNNVIHYLTYDGFKALIQNSAFATCNGKALGIKSSAIGDGTVAYEGQSVTGKFNKKSGSETYEDGETLDVRDAITIIGNGTADGTRSNGIEVYRNHIKSKLAPKHYDDIVRLRELNSIAKNRIVGSFGSRVEDENGNVLYDNTHTQIIRSNLSVLEELDSDENYIRDEYGNTIGGKVYASKQIHSLKIIGDIVEAGKIVVGTETNSGAINLVGPTAGIFINDKPIDVSGSGVNGGTKIYKHTITGHITNTGDGLYFNVEFYSFSETAQYRIGYGGPECYLIIESDSIFLRGPLYGANAVDPLVKVGEIGGNGAVDYSYCEISIHNNVDWNGEYVSHTIEHEVVGV